MNQPPMNRLPSEPMRDDASLEDRLARVWAHRAEQAHRAAPPTRLAPDPQSLEEILARTWARRAEQARLASPQAPVHPAPLERPQVEANTLPGQNGQSEDKESANLLSDEMGGPSVLSVSFCGEPNALPTQTGPGPDAETTANLTDESAAHPSPTPDQTGFTGGLPNEESQAARTTLTDEIKEFIVKGLACYDTPSQVAEAVNLMFGVTISRQRVNRYRPDNPRPPAQRWRDLHAATRQALLRELAEIGIAHRAVRLRRLDRMASRAERNNVRTSLKCLEMAAKECGGIYENRRPVVLQVPMPLASLRQAPA